MEYLLFVRLKNKKIESYFGDDVEELRKYAEFRKFSNFEIYELKKVT